MKMWANVYAVRSFLVPFLAPKTWATKEDKDCNGLTAMLSLVVGEGRAGITSRLESFWSFVECRRCGWAWGQTKIAS